MAKYQEFDLIFQEMTEEQAEELYEIITDYATAHDLDMAGNVRATDDSDYPWFDVPVWRFYRWLVKVWKVLHGKKDA